jgi:WD40 repeat protein
MPLPRLEKPRWLTLLLGLSLLLNVVLLMLIASRRNQQVIRDDRPGMDDRPGGASGASSNARGSDRVLTEGLPPGCRMILRGHPGSISTVCFAGDGSRLGVTTDRGYITVLGLSSRKAAWESDRLGRDDGYGLEDHLLARSRTGDRLAYVLRGGSAIRESFTVQVRDLGAGRETTIQVDPTDLELRGCMGLAFSPDGRTVAAGGMSGVGLFEVAGEAVRGPFQAKRLYYTDLSYSADGTYLLARTSPIPVVVFDTRSGTNIANWKVKPGRHDKLSGAVLSPDASRIAASGSDNRVTLWETRTGREIISIKEGLGSAISDGRCWVAFSSDGKFMLTASRDEDGSRIFVRRRSTIDGSLINKAEITQPGGSCPYLYPRLFTADGTLLALVGRKEETRIVPEPDMGLVTVREGVVAIYDTSQLLGGRMTPKTTDPQAGDRRTEPRSASDPVRGERQVSSLTCDE